MTAKSKNESVCGERTYASNSTIFFDVDPYGGIPSNLIINLIVFCIFVVIFLVLHKKAYRLVNDIVRKDKGQKHLQSLRSDSSGIAQDSSHKENGDKGLYTQFHFSYLNQYKLFCYFIITKHCIKNNGLFNRQERSYKYITYRK